MLPLEDVKVVSIEQAVAAPLASRHLADFGARVIKIERPGTGDFARAYDETVRGYSSWFVWLNRSKQSLTLDLKHAQASAILEKLLASADVLLHNLAPGAAERLGLDGPALLAKHARLIVCEISGYGSSGPYRNKKAYDLLIQNETGVVSLTGWPETPSKAGISVADIAAGMYAFSGILLALRRREQTGRGTVLQVSLFDALSEWVLPAGYYAAYGGSPPPRSGAEHASIAPYGPYKCGDGSQIILAIQNEREWERFCTSALRQPGLAADPRFRTNSQRSANRQALRAAIEAVFGTLTREQAIARLEEAGIANAQMNTVQEFWEHPQHAVRNRWRSVASPAGAVQALAPPVILEGVEPRMDAIPALGQHTEGILSELGYTAEQIRELRAAAAI
jgi:crotonobetainyl-CoA:carnitine CoA-transferase CaiB-like acyl-CoA transferase